MLESDLNRHVKKLDKGYADCNGFRALYPFQRMTYRRLLLIIIAVAVLLRVLSAVYQGNVVAPLPGIYDQISYDGLARRVLHGYGFSFEEGHWPVTPAGEPTAHWSYLYTLYLVAVYSIFYTNPLAARIIQSVAAGIIHIWLAWRIGNRIFGSKTGLIFAGLSAVYVYFVYYAGGLLTETFYILGVLWSLDASLRIVKNYSTSDLSNRAMFPQTFLWLELGLAIGISALLRQVFLLFAPFLFIWLWWNLSDLRINSSIISGWTQRLFCMPVLKGVSVSTLVLVALIAPWSVRNYRVYKTFVPLNTNAGFAFFWGNHPSYGNEYVSLLPGGAQNYRDLIPAELLSLNEANLDKALLRQGIGFVFDDPVRIVRLSIGRAREYFKFWPSKDSSILSNISRVGSFGIAMPFILYGVWISTKRIRHPQRRHQAAAIILFYLFIVIYSSIHLVSWALIRYRLPVDSILLLFAALGLTEIFKYKIVWKKPSAQTSSPIEISE